MNVSVRVSSRVRVEGGLQPWTLIPSFGKHVRASCAPGVLNPVLQGRSYSMSGLPLKILVSIH